MDDWEEFSKFAREFYKRCLEIATDTAGAGNADTTQVMLRCLSPDLLRLYDWWSNRA